MVSFSKLCSLFMLYLIVSLVFAWPISARLTEISVSGMDGKDGFRRSEDITQVYAKTDDGKIWMKSNSQFVPVECFPVENETNEFECRHVFEKSILDSGEYTLKFQHEIFDSGVPSSVEFPVKFFVDSDAPSLVDFDLDVVGENIELYYSVKDYSGQFVGSGVKQISLFTDSHTLYEKELNQSQVDFDSFENNISGQNLVGNVSFYLGIRDSVGNYQKIFLKNQFVDLKKPVIDDEVKFMVGGNEITQISSQPEFSPIVTMEFRVDEDFIDKAYVDVSDGNLDPRTNEDYANKEAVCSKTDVKYTCKVSNIYLNPGKNKVNVLLTVIDSQGNIGEKLVTKEFEYVEEQGEIVWFGPEAENHCHDNNCYIKKGVNEIVLDIEKGQAEIIPSFITAYTQEISKVAKTKPIVCEDQGEISSCKFYLSASADNLQHKSVKKIVLTNPTTDAIGTPLKGIASRDVFLDFEKAENKTPINFTSKIGNVIAVDPCVVADETATFSVQAYDDFSPKLKIIAHTQNISGKEKFEKWCTPLGSGNFNCSLDVNNFVSTYVEDDVKIELVDLAGNSLELTKKVSVCFSDATTIPEVISKVETKDLPEIDLYVSSVIPLKVYIPIKFYKKPRTKIIALDSDNCMQTAFGGGQDSYYIGANKANEDWLMFVTQVGGYQHDFEEDEGDIEVPLNCTLKIYVQTEHTRYVLPEEEPLNEMLNGYRLPFGKINDSVEAKLKNIKDEIKDLNSDVKSAKEVQVWLDRACMIGDVVGTVRNVMGTLKTQVYGVAVVLHAVPYVGAAAGTGLWSGFCSATAPVQSFLGGLWPKDSLTFNAFGSMFKIFCMINKCSQCSLSGLISLATTSISAVKSFTDLKSLQDATKTAEKELEKSEKKVSDREKTIEDKKELDKKIDSAKRLEDKKEILKAERPGSVVDKMSEDQIDNAMKQLKTDNTGEIKQQEAYLANEKSDLEYAKTSLEKATEDLNKLTGKEKEKEETEDEKSADADSDTETVSKTAEKVIEILVDDDEKSNNKVVEEATNTVGMKNKGLVNYPGDLENLQVKDEGLFELDPNAKQPTTIIPNPEGTIIEKTLIVPDIPKLKLPDNPLNLKKIEVPEVTYGEITPPTVSSWDKTIGWLTNPDKFAMGADIKTYWDHRTLYDMSAQDWYDTANNIALSLANDPDFDPYKSMTVSAGCGCWPANIYNKEKKMQMLCKEYTCIEESIASGTPIQMCERTYGAEKCLYYTGAYFTAEGDNIDDWIDIIYGDVANMQPEEWWGLGLSTGCFLLEMFSPLAMSAQCGTVFSPAIVCEGVKIYQFWSDLDSTLNSFISPFIGKKVENEYCEGII